jgi:hypothetical protein
VIYLSWTTSSCANRASSSRMMSDVNSCVSVFACIDRRSVGGRSGGIWGSLKSGF